MVLNMNVFKWRVTLKFTLRTECAGANKHSGVENTALNESKATHKQTKHSSCNGIHNHFHIVLFHASHKCEFNSLQ